MGAIFFEHLLYGDNIVYENRMLLENVILREDKIPYMKRVDLPTKRP